MSNKKPQRILQDLYECRKRFNSSSGIRNFFFFFKSRKNPSEPLKYVLTPPKNRIKSLSESLKMLQDLSRIPKNPLQGSGYKIFKITIPMRFHSVDERKHNFYGRVLILKKKKKKKILDDLATTPSPNSQKR